MSTRYYSPNLGRFLNADAFTSTGQGLLGNNMFTYCLNNPVMYSDDTGNRPVWESNLGSVTVYSDTGTGIDTETSGVRKVTDAVVNGVTYVFFVTGFIHAGIIMNNVINAVYYQFSSKKSYLEWSSEKSSYTEGYITRWDRLDYTKQATGDSSYFSNAWRYNSEYSVHMYGWYLTGWAKDRGIPILSKWAKNFEKADIFPHSKDGRPVVDIATFVFGLLGI